MSYNPNAGGTVADGSVTTAKLGGDITAAGKALLDDADAAAQRTTLGLGTAATTEASAYASASHTHPATDITGRTTLSSVVLNGTQANSTVTPVVLTGATFTLTPGQSGTFTGIIVFTAAAITTGIGAGFRVTQAASANGNAQGSWLGYVNLSSSAAATGLSDGDVFNVAANANAYGELLGTATTAGNNAVLVTAVVKNTSSNANTTVTFEFRSEVATSAVTAQIGSGVTAVIG